MLTVLALALLGIIIEEVGGPEGTRRFWRVVAWVIGGLMALAFPAGLIGVILASLL